MFGFLKNFFLPSSNQTINWSLYRCFICNVTIRDGVNFPDDQLSFCMRCFATTPCFSCGLPCGPVHRRLSDDRIICEHCYTHALLTPRQLLPMYEATLHFFQKKMKMKMKDQPRLKVVDSRYMESHFGAGPFTWGVYVDSGPEEVIFILAGVASDKALATLAHELTHFWQKRYCPKGQSLELIEGFAEWVAYQIAKYKQLDRTMLAIRRNQAEPYQTGLQKMFQLEAKKGVKGVVKYVTKKRVI